MAALEKSKKTSKKQKIDRKSNLEQKNKKTSSIGVRFVKWKTKKEKKSEGPSPLGEGGAQRAEDSVLSSHHLSHQ